MGDGTPLLILSLEGVVDFGNLTEFCLGASSLHS